MCPARAAAPGSDELVAMRMRGRRLSALIVALVSPLAELAHERFLAHMGQHLLLISVAAPAILIANPLAVSLWGLPRGLRRTLGGLLAARTSGRRVVALLTLAPVAWLLHALVLWLWHTPALYDAAVAASIVHDTEHVLFFATAVLYWWPVIGPAPRVRKPLAPATLVAYLVLGAFQASALGLWLMTRPSPLYRSSTVSAAAWAMTPLEDQISGGLLMWVVSAAVDMGAVLLVLFRFFVGQEDRVGTRFLDPAPPVRDN